MPFACRCLFAGASVRAHDLKARTVQSGTARQLGRKTDAESDSRRLDPDGRSETSSAADSQLVRPHAALCALAGGTGNDTLVGRPGRDVLSGHAGNDASPCRHGLSGNDLAKRLRCVRCACLSVRWQTSVDLEARGERVFGAVVLVAAQCSGLACETGAGGSGAPPGPSTKVSGETAACWPTPGRLQSHTPPGKVACSRANCVDEKTTGA